MEQSRWGDGTFYLRLGLGRCPENFEARYALAQYYVRTGARSLALALVADGMLHGYPTRKILERTFIVVEAGEDWTSGLRICERGLSQLDKTSQWSERQWLLGRQLAALIGLGRAEDALALAEAEGEQAGPSVKLQRGQALLALDRSGEAAALLAGWATSASAMDVRRFLKLEAEAWRKAGRLAEMEQPLEKLRALEPALKQPLAYAVEQHARAGHQADAALDNYLFRFGGTANNLFLAARPLARIPDVGLLRRVHAAARERGFAMPRFHAQLGEALLRAGDLAALPSFMADIEPDFESERQEARYWLEWMRAVANAVTAPGSGTTLTLLNLMRTWWLSLEAYRMTIAALRQAGQDDSAREVITFARRLYPESPSLLAQEAELDQVLAAAPPSPPLKLPERPRVAANWNDFHQPLDEAMAAGRWSDAHQMLRDARRAIPVPDWLGTRTAELAWREIQTSHAVGARALLQLAARYFVTGSAGRSARVLALARQWMAADSRDDALILVKAVIEKSPEHPNARQLLARLQPEE